MATFAAVVVSRGRLIKNTQGTCTRHTRHTRPSWMVIYLKNMSLHREGKSCGEQCSTKYRSMYHTWYHIVRIEKKYLERFEQKTKKKTSKNVGYRVQNNASKRKLGNSFYPLPPAEKEVRAHATHDTLHGSRPKLYHCLPCARTALPCRPLQRLCERCAYEEI